MKKQHHEIDRRDFLRAIGVAGVSSLFARGETTDSNSVRRPGKDVAEKVPKRKLGKTGIEVPCLSLGSNVVDSQVILTAAFKRGITYWDTANSYIGGRSELNIGRFLSKNPQKRKEIFLVTKASRSKTIADIEERLATSLERMKTNYIDLYFGVHGLSEPERLSEELKAWVKSAKKRKLIRYFGFSTHKNMDICLLAASQLDWIDAIMTSYNFRLMQDEKLQRAIDACHKAGIGLVAMKTVALSIKRRRLMGLGKKTITKEDRKLIEHFLKRGFSTEQAAIKYVLEDERIASACVGVKSVSILNSNTAAVLDKVKLGRQDRAVLSEYARLTCSGYCAGCGRICDSAVPDMPYISDIMRYLMYHNSYGERGRAKASFAKIPAGVRERLLDTDYAAAEARCRQKLPIDSLITEAVGKLA